MSALLFALSLLVPLQGDRPLERTIAFADARQCHWSPSFEALVRAMAAFDESTSSVAVGAPVETEGHGTVQPRIERVSRHGYVAVLDLAGDWHGLSLRRIELESGIESGPSNLGMVFAEPPEIALRRLNALGFDLPAVGEARMTETEVIESGVRLERHPLGSVLWCFSD